MCQRNDADKTGSHIIPSFLMKRINGGGQRDHEIGFVSRHSKTRQLKGVREDSRYGKQICVLAEDLKGTIEPNVLYSVELKPMHKAKGYVIVAAFARTAFCDSRDHNHSPNTRNYIL